MYTCIVISYTQTQTHKHAWHHSLPYHLIIFTYQITLLPPSYLYSLPHYLTHTLTPSLTCLLTQSFINSLTHSITHSLTHSLTHSHTPSTHSIWSLWHTGFHKSKSQCVILFNNGDLHNLEIRVAMTRHSTMPKLGDKKNCFKTPSTPSPYQSPHFI